MEIPVAVPLRVPSSEARRRHDEEIIQEEMDIGATSTASAPPVRPGGDSASRGPADIPSSSRFALKESSREGGTSSNSNGNGNSTTSRISNNADEDDDDDLGDLALSTASLVEPGQKRHGTSKNKSGRPRRGEMSASRFSFDEPWRRQANRPPAFTDGRRRGYSVGNTNLQSQRHGSGSAGLYDDDEGDLGFSAAQGMEDSQRKVIVERLEAVKSKPPVFTWC